MEAADNCGADWNEQAVAAAKSAIEPPFSSSHDALVEKLEKDEQFTHDQAVHGADNCGADWNEQAAIMARNYLVSHADWTRDKVIAQLEFEKYTHDQAVYAAEKAGL